MGIFSNILSPQISVLRLSGIIGDYGPMSGLSLHSINEYIEEAFAIKRLTAVFLVINSPGGSPAQSDLIAKRIKFLSNKKSIPVYSFIEDVGASGGYWIACCADKIFSLESSIVGSIGVISTSFGFQDAIKKLGIERRIYTQGKNKCLLDKFLPENQEGVAILKRIQQNLHNTFIDYVKTSRKAKLSSTEELFDGSIWIGQEAKKLGLIDDVKDMYSFAKENFPENTILKFVKKKESWIKKKLGINYSPSYAIDELMYYNKIKNIYQI
jgi:signal peptide peptidase SppA